ncbi:hypothetical protein DFR44_10131 [Hydromonas duriensis]|uniref:Uncharacterized protein n=1 Tax=Hydromonas duriensis TaxID=1527608 RepID=A0A4R6YBH2_9BURK|nr:hypothetical protein DFR44_10131 [Hydromonas duriensis]
MEVPYNGSGGGAFKYYIAPESKYEHRIDSVNPVNRGVDTVKVMVVSIAKSFPHGGVEYFTKAYACSQQPGTTFTKINKASNDWDPRFQISPYGTVDWRIWNNVCKI